MRANDEVMLRKWVNYFQRLESNLGVCLRSAVFLCCTWNRSPGLWALCPQRCLLSSEKPPRSPESAETCRWSHWICWRHQAGCWLPPCSSPPTECLTSGRQTHRSKRIKKRFQRRNEAKTSSHPWLATVVCVIPAIISCSKKNSNDMKSVTTTLKLFIQLWQYLFVAFDRTCLAHLCGAKNITNQWLCALSS